MYVPKLFVDYDMIPIAVVPVIADIIAAVLKESLAGVVMYNKVDPYDLIEYD